MTSIRATKGDKVNCPNDGQLTLANMIARLTAGKNRFDTPVKGLSLHRWEMPTEPTSYMHPPSICLIAQGRKRVYLGEDHYVYDAQGFLISSVELPLVAEVLDASKDKPYLGLTLELDLKMAAQIMLGNDMPPFRPSQDRLGIAVGKVSPPLLDAFRRLVHLLENPEDIFTLAPLIQQEILYRLLISEQGPRIRQITSIDSHSYQIARVIGWLKENYDKPFRIEDLAQRAGLSPSAFHNHFRSVTALSPLQYQKRIRLNEARRLMFAENMDASTAAFQVGYESPSQFSREYSRLFGSPPKRDMKILGSAVAEDIDTSSSFRGK